METKPGYNQDALKSLKAKHGFSFDYIRKSIRGDRVGATSDLLKKEYKTLVAKQTNSINTTH